MAPNLVDIFSLITTITLCAGFVFFAVYGLRTIQAGIASTKESLKSKGLTVSRTGVSLKTDKRMDRDEYLNATQRGFVNLVEASSFRRGDGTVVTPGPLLPSRSTESNDSHGVRKNK
ncbi:hypothetical protein FA15DRAFT_672442 [Coprinopsis marcescibilis]|uniref:Uncharacterized protein n=1 Tax=Coprinopsis marcescibilis TaxID=230819 RepID=A0A5C3KMA4_COPMA|nr:hypothetical protein FA15DRAFT_672442 [Coprinopsis marcescibilis]